MTEIKIVLTLKNTFICSDTEKDRDYKPLLWSKW